jgi:PAS domain S-box-containing protein
MKYDPAELAQTLFEEAGDALFLFDPDSEQLLDVNPMAQRLSGWTRQALLKFPITYLFRSEAPQGLQRLRNAFKKTGLFHSQEGFLLRHQRDGVWLPVNLTISRLHAEPKTLGLLTARDVREQRETLEQLRRTEARLATILSTTVNGMMQIDTAGVVTYANPAAGRILGVHRAELIGSNRRDAAWQAQRWDGQPIGDDDFTFLKVLRNGQPVQDVERLIRRPDGTQVSVTLNAAPVLDARGVVVGVVVSLTDVTAQRRAEQAVRDSEEKYRNLVETSHDLIWVLDAQGRISFVNQNGARHFYGREPEEIIGRPFTELLDPAEIARNERAFQHVRAHGSLFNFETVTRRKDGTRVYGSANFLVLRDERGNFLGTTATALDITARKLAEEALRSSEQRYRLLVERNLAGFVRSTPDGRVLDCNEALARIFGFDSKEEFQQQNTFSFYFQPEERTELLRRLQEQGHLRNHEGRRRRRDGNPVWILESVSQLMDEQGEIVYEATIIDITERKEAEEALRASEAKYRALIENLEQCIFLKDRDLRFVAVNRPFAASLGQPEEAIVGRTDFDFYPADLAEKYRNDDLGVLQEGRRLETEEENLAAGRRRVVRVIKTPVRNGDGHVEGVLGIFWDVSEQRALEAQLRQAQKMEGIGQLAGGIAHDFNNLLQAVLGNVSLALSGMPVSDPNRSLIVAAEKATLRASDLVRKLLGFSRQTLLHLQPLQLNNVVAETLEILRRSVDPQIHVEFQPAPGLGMVQADPSQIGQVILNLCINARDAMPQGGRLTLSTANVLMTEEQARRHVGARSGAGVCLRVEDTGHGMTPDVQARIFEPFFTTKEAGKGTGLGLAMVFGIVQQHQGWIDCASEPGRGTTFTIWLPRHEGPVASAPGPAKVSPNRGHETILFVEDEPVVRMVGRTILERFGYNVLLAEDGRDAVEVYQREGRRIDLVILDLTMPRLSGREALPELMKLDPQVRVIFSSGYSAEPPVPPDDRNVFGFIGKPYRPDELASTVRSVLDRAATKGRDVVTVN